MIKRTVTTVPFLLLYRQSLLLSMLPNLHADTMIDVSNEVKKYQKLDIENGQDDYETA